MSELEVQDSPRELDAEHIILGDHPPGLATPTRATTLHVWAPWIPLLLFCILTLAGAIVTLAEQQVHLMLILGSVFLFFTWVVQLTDDVIFHPQWRLNKWRRDNASKEYELWGKLRSSYECPQFEVNLIPTRDELKVQLTRYFKSEREVIQEASFTSDDGDTIEKASNLKGEWEEMALEKQREARLQYIEEHWETYRECLELYDSQALKVRNLLEALDHTDKTQLREKV